MIPRTSDHKFVLHTVRDRAIAKRSWRSRQARIFWIALRRLRKLQQYNVK